MKEQQARACEASFRACGWDVWTKPDKVGGWLLYANPANGGEGLLYGFSHNDMKCFVLAGQVARLKLREGDRVKRSDADEPTSIPAYRDMRGVVVGFDWTVVLVEWDGDGGVVSRHRPENVVRDEPEL